MNKLKTVLLVLFAIIILVLVFFLFKNINSSNNTNNDDKLISEIKYMENKLSSLLNGVNGINLDNYKITVTKTSTSSNSQEQNGGGNSEEKGGSSGQESKEENSGSSQGSRNSGSSEESSTPEEEYSMKQNGILTNDFNTDWESTKNEVENLYNILPVVTLDLYGKNIGQKEILDFNKELDNLTVAVKEENKQESLNKLVTLYEYLPKYTKNIENQSYLTNILTTKLYVYNAYSILDTNNWQGVIENIKNAQQSYMSVVNNSENVKQDLDNKIYIILNELENAASLKDKDIFLIKYKNFLEEIEASI